MRNWYRFRFTDGTYLWVHTHCGWIGLLKFADSLDEDKYNGTIITEVTGVSVIKCLICKYILHRNYAEVR